MTYKSKKFEIGALLQPGIYFLFDMANEYIDKQNKKIKNGSNFKKHILYNNTF